MRTPNTLLIVMATILVGASGCSQLRSRRTPPLDEAVRQVELAPPAVSEFRKANANEPVKLANGQKPESAVAVQPPTVVAKRSDDAVSKPVPIPHAGEPRSSRDGEFMIGKKITKSQPSKDEGVSELAKSSTDPTPAKDLAKPSLTSGSSDLASSLPGPSISSPGKLPGELPSALPPAPVNAAKHTEPAESKSVVPASAIAASEGKKIPHAVARTRDLGGLPPAVVDGVKLHDDQAGEGESSVVAKAEEPKKVEPAVAEIAPSSVKPEMPSPPVIVSAVSEVASTRTESRPTEHVDPLVKPVSGQVESMPAPSGLPAAPPALPAAPTPVSGELPAAVVASVESKPPTATITSPPVAVEEKKIVTVMEVAAKAPIAPAIPVVSEADTRPVSVEKNSTGTLETDRLHLCTEIIGFGKTVLRESEAVLPGERCLAYLEVRNFASKQLEREYETKLGCDLSLENSAGQTVFNQTFPDIVDKSVSPRRDFFCHFLFTMPTTVLPGKYTLRLRIVDRTNGSTSDAIAEVLVGAKESSNSVSDGDTAAKRSRESTVTALTPNRLESSEGNKSKGLGQ